MKNKSLILFILILIFIGCNKNENIVVVDSEIKSITISVYDENDSTYNSLEISSKEKVVFFHDTIFIGLNFIYKKDTLFEGYFNWDNGQIFSLDCYYLDKIPKPLDSLFNDFNSDIICEVSKDFDMDTSYFCYYGEAPFRPNMQTSIGDIIPNNPYNGRFLNYNIQSPFTGENYIEIKLTTEFKIQSIKFLYIKDKDKLRI